MAPPKVASGYDDAFAIVFAQIQESHTHPGVGIVSIRADGVDPLDHPLQLEWLLARRREGEIELRPDGERLCLSVHDTGAGIGTDRQSLGGRRGVGLENVESRLLRYYGDVGRLHITSDAAGGTLVEITLAS